MKKRSESTLVTECMKYLNLLQNTRDVFWFSRMQSGDVCFKDYHSKRFRRLRLCPAGTPDILVLVRQPFTQAIYNIWIECKAPKGKLSPEQTSFKDEIQRHSKDTYFLITDVQQLVNYFGREQ